MSKIKLVVFASLLTISGLAQSGNYMDRSTLNEQAEYICRASLYTENQQSGSGDLVYDSRDGKVFGIYELKDNVAEVWIKYNRRKSNGTLYKGVAKICDIRVPEGTKLVNGELI